MNPVSALVAGFRTASAHTTSSSSSTALGPCSTIRGTAASDAITSSKCPITIAVAAGSGSSRTFASSKTPSVPSLPTIRSASDRSPSPTNASSAYPDTRRITLGYRRSISSRFASTIAAIPRYSSPSRVSR